MSYPPPFVDGRTLLYTARSFLVETSSPLLISVRSTGRLVYQRDWSCVLCWAPTAFSSSSRFCSCPFFRLCLILPLQLYFQSRVAILMSLSCLRPLFTVGDVCLVERLIQKIFIKKKQRLGRLAFWRQVPSTSAMRRMVPFSSPTLMQMWKRYQLYWCSST